jgi:tetratricopeptide (TPR) repeat protein
MKAYRKQQAPKKVRFDTTIDDDDRRRGRELGIADDIHEWTFASPDRVARGLAEFTILGITPFWLDVERVAVRPSLAELDPALGKQALALIEDARREVRAQETGDDLQTAMAEITDLHAESLLRLGRREEAIAQWQGFLEQYPKAPEYQAFEAKIEALLGISAPAQAFEAALAACSNEVFGLLYEQVERMGRAEGSAGVRRLVAAIEQQCVRGPSGPSYAVQAYFLAGRDAALRGDCALYRDMRGRATKLGPQFAAPFESADPQTAHCR